MKIIISPQAFKGTLNALEAADAIASGVRQVFPNAELMLLPLADGGDSTLEILLKKFPSIRHEQPYVWGELTETKEAVIESAQICGLALLPASQRNPLLTSSYPIGKVILRGLDKGLRRFFIGIGGTATNDGGAGIAQALGVRFLDQFGNELPRGGGALENLKKIDFSKMDSRIKEAQFIAACDVENPLLGPKGATRIYSPQKGATPQMVEKLEKSLAKFAQTVKNQMGVEIGTLPRGGAGGGMAAGLFAFFGAKLESGVQTILDRLHFSQHLMDADLILTGEGRLDDQTFFGQGPYILAQIAKNKRIPIIAIVGQISGPGNGFDAIIPLSFWPVEPASNSYELVTKATFEAMRCLKIGIIQHSKRSSAKLI